MAGAGTNTRPTRDTQASPLCWYAIASAYASLPPHLLVNVSCPSFGRLPDRSNASKCTVAHYLKRTTGNNNPCDPKLSSYAFYQDFMPRTSSFLLSSALLLPRRGCSASFCGAMSVNVRGVRGGG